VDVPITCPTGIHDSYVSPANARSWRHATAVDRERRRPALARNEIWSMDSVADQLADGRRFRALTVIDLFTRECLAIDVGHGLGGQDVVAALERLRFERGLPQRIYCVVQRALLRRVFEHLLVRIP
jgi:transposase InsO family protein